MKGITWISRLLVGVLFIFSGLIKLNDPLGFSYKLHDYFAPDVLNLGFLDPVALPLALFIVILEVLLGVALLIGWRPRLTLNLLVLLIVFFTFLTFYSAYFNKVTDCGCFGDAIPLTPWESFTKDVILLVLILFLLFGKRYLKPAAGPRLQAYVLTLSLIFCAWMGYYVLAHLPFIDFRPYAIGKSIPEGMRSAEELGLEPPRYGVRYTLENSVTGENMVLEMDEYMSGKWWEKPEWQIKEDLTESYKISEGYEPPIHDFMIELEGEDRTSELMELPALFLVVTKKVESANTEGFENIRSLAQEAEAAGIPLYALTSSGYEAYEAFRHEHQLAFPFVPMDETTLKTIVRANPGILLLKNGVVAGKWHHNDLPSFSAIQAEHL